MADEKETKFYADGTPIQDYPKWVRTGEGDKLKEQICASKEEEDAFLGNVKETKPAKEWGKDNK